MTEVAQQPIQPTTETQRRINERHVQLLGQIGLLDWQAKQIQQQMEAKYREIEAMLREQPHMQALERDLLERAKRAEVPIPLPGVEALRAQRNSNVAQPQVFGAEQIAQNETVWEKARGEAGPRQANAATTDAGERVVAQEAIPASRAQTRARAAAKRVSGKKRAAKPAPARPTPVERLADTSVVKRGRGRPRKHPVAAVPPPEDLETMPAAANGADLDAAFGAM